MDKKTHDKLKEVGQSIPKKYHKDLIKTTKYGEHLKEEIKEKAINARGLSIKGRENNKKIYDKLERQGMFDREKVEVNEKAQAKIQEYTDGKFNAMVRRGDLKPPKKPDGQMKQWLNKIKENRSKKYF